LPPEICAGWTERSLRTAPPLFLARIKWPQTQAAADRAGLALVEYLKANQPLPPDSPGHLADPPHDLRAIDGAKNLNVI
jgi:hypothetical protein